MNVIPVKAAIAGASAFVLAATSGGTLGSSEDATTVPRNVLGAGVLELDVRAVGATTNLTLTDLRPGSLVRQRYWATNGLESSVPATLSITLHDLIDVPAACNVSRAKAEGELASRIEGCSITPTAVTGTPNTGVLSRLIEISGAYDPGAQTAATCADEPVTLQKLINPGDLHAIADADHGAGTTAQVTDAVGRAVVRSPGQGFCVVISIAWPQSRTDVVHASPEDPVDDAAQGDSATVAVRFDLTQVLP